MRKINWTKTFTLDNMTEIECGWQNTSYGFRHLAVLRRNGCRLVETKACYYNRTWEAYEYQSVVHAAIRKAFDEAQAKAYMDKVDGKGHTDAMAPFKMTGMVAMLGDILCDSPKDKNDWKARMLKAGLPGLDIPEDWDGLGEAEKGRRLDAVIAMAREV